MPVTAEFDFCVRQRSNTREGIRDRQPRRFGSQFGDLDQGATAPTLPDIVVDPGNRERRSQPRPLLAAYISGAGQHRATQVAHAMSPHTPHTPVSQDVYPPVIGYVELSELLDKRVSTLQADHSRAPYKLPPACYLPGCRSPRWLLSDVLDWLAQYRAPPPAPPAPAARRRGRPTKAEQIAAAAAARGAK